MLNRLALPEGRCLPNCGHSAARCELVMYQCHCRQAVIRLDMVSRLRKRRSGSESGPEPHSWRAIALRCKLTFVSCWLQASCGMLGDGEPAEGARISQVPAV